MSNHPPSSHDGVLERTADGGVIRFERRLPYPIRAVWDAITDPERLADWWLPFDADITVDLTEGGQMVFVSRDAEPMTMTMTILRVEPPMLLEHTHLDTDSYMRWCRVPAADPPPVLASVMPDGRAGQSSSVAVRPLMLVHDDPPRCVRGGGRGDCCVAGATCEQQHRTDHQRDPLAHTVPIGVRRHHLTSVQTDEVSSEPAPALSVGRGARSLAQ